MERRIIVNPKPNEKVIASLVGIIHVFLREPNKIIVPKKDGYEGTRIMRAGRALVTITIMIYDSTTLAPGEKKFNKIVLKKRTFAPYNLDNILFEAK